VRVGGERGRLEVVVVLALEEEYGAEVVLGVLGEEDEEAEAAGDYYPHDTRIRLKWK
jgi:hypothetical protein